MVIQGQVTGLIPFLYVLDDEKKAQTEALAMIMIENDFSKQKEMIEDMTRERSGSNERVQNTLAFEQMQP